MNEGLEDLRELDLLLAMTPESLYGGQRSGGASLMSNVETRIFFFLFSSWSIKYVCTLMKTVLVQLDSSNKIPHTKIPLINNGNLFLKVLEDKSKIKPPAWFYSGEGPLPGSQPVPLLCPHMVKGDMKLSRVFYKSMNPFHVGFILMT